MGKVQPVDRNARDARERDGAVAAFWDAQAAKGPTAGTRDRILKRLEIEAIARHVQPGTRVLDAGCGDGETALALATRTAVQLDAFDRSAAMIAVARAAQTRQRVPAVRFFVGDVLDAPPPAARQGRYHLVYTERCLINLADWDAQRAAIRNLAGWLRPGGRLVLVENSQDALDNLNALRAALDLPKIEPPWHNRYLRDSDLYGFAHEPDCPLRLADCDDFTATYYLLSRVVNARLAANAGHEPDYAAPVNQLALRLPGALGGRKFRIGQTRLWVWEKTA